MSRNSSLPAIKIKGSYNKTSSTQLPFFKDNASVISMRSSKHLRAKEIDQINKEILKIGKDKILKIECGLTSSRQHHS